MGQATALRVAIDLVHVPSRVRIMRAAPLPSDVHILLRIAAGDEAAEIEAAELTGRSPEVVRKAAAFFIEQVLLCPGADSYRVLGAPPQASSGELRRNMALLLKWLHPDMDQKGHRSIFATRVTGAWDELKTPARRADHDGVAAELREKKARIERSKGSTRSRRKALGKFLVRTPQTGKKPGLIQRVLWYLRRRPKY